LWNPHPQLPEAFQLVGAHLTALCSDTGLDGVVVLRSKAPRWSGWQGVHTVEFESPLRVLEPSRKNIALVDAFVEEKGGEGGGGRQQHWAGRRKAPHLLQIGKVGEDRFSLDFRLPLSPFQALSIAIAAFEA
jgi:hypothetical protein